MAKIALTDTCYWFGLVDPNDQFHQQSNIIAEFLTEHVIVLPWPCMYETVSTHLVRSRERLLNFETRLKETNIQMLDDAPYKIEALSEVFEYSRMYGHSFSLADAVIRGMLKDEMVHVDYLVTFNRGDFADICDERGIEIIA